MKTEEVVRRQRAEAGFWMGLGELGIEEPIPDGDLARLYEIRRGTITAAEKRAWESLKVRCGAELDRAAREAGIRPGTSLENAEDAHRILAEQGYQWTWEGGTE